MKKRDWGRWARLAGIRAVKTMAQVGGAYIGSAALLSDINWQILASTMIASGLLSLFTSVAGLPEE